MRPKLPLAGWLAVLVCLVPLLAQQKRNLNEDPNIRSVSGVVTDTSGRPVKGAVVQLKDTKTSKIVNFATKDDGKFAFRDLSMEINYELLAKRGDVATPVRKVSIYDTRKDVTVNFTL